MINAFLLAWLTHLTTKILADVHFKLFGSESVMELFEDKEVKETAKVENGRSKENGHSKENDNKNRRRGKILKTSSNVEVFKLNLLTTDRFTSINPKYFIRLK